MKGEFKKILFVIPSLGSGGAERVICTLANEMTARGYEARILMTSAMRLHYQLSEAVKLHSLECDSKYGGMNTLKRYISRIRDIRAELKKTDADVIVSFMSETNMDVCFAAMGLKIPVIVSERNDPAIDPASRAKQLLRRLAYCRAGGFVFQTPDAQAYFSQKIQKMSCIIFNPLTAQIPEPYRGDRDKRIVAVGRLNKQKNFPLLIDAYEEFAQSYPEYKLEIYGEGPQEEQLKAYLTGKNLQEQVFLKGFCKDVHDKIRTAAFFVMTSDFEGMPNALVEAMALGMPCISTDCRCGGPRQLIQDGENGLLVPVRDKKALVQAMVKLAADPQLAKPLGENAQSIKKQVDTQTVVNQWISYIGRCLG